jgi:hypothetical protein
VPLNSVEILGYGHGRKYFSPGWTFSEFWRLRSLRHAVMAHSSQRVAKRVAQFQEKPYREIKRNTDVD